MVIYSKKCEATDENDLEFAIVVFRVGTHIDKEEEDFYLFVYFINSIHNNNI